MYKLGSQGIGDTTNLSLVLNRSYTSEFNWQVKIYYKDATIKKEWHIGQDECPIKSVSYEKNKKICGAGKIDLAYLDFPLDGGDYIEIYFNNEIEYSAEIENSADPKGGSIKLVPFSDRLQKLYHSKLYTNKTGIEILEDVIQSNFTDTKIAWNPYLIEITSDEQFTRDYTNYDTLKKIIDDTVNIYDNYEWGVTAHRFFTVYQPSNEIDKYLILADEPDYTYVTSKKEFSKINATGYIVYKKNIDGDAVLVGFVGFETTPDYPPLDIEREIGRKIIKKYTLPDVLLTDDECLRIAYDDLKANAVLPETTSISSINLESYYPKIGEYIVVQDKPEYIRKNIINCDSLIKDDNTMLNHGRWFLASLSDIEKIEGSNSITFKSNKIGDGIIYDFERIVKFFQPIKIGFMIKQSIAGNYLELGIGDYFNNGWASGVWSFGKWSENIDNTGLQKLFDTTAQIYVPNGDKWKYLDFPMSELSINPSQFRYFGLRTHTVPPEEITIYIDRIDLYLYDRSVYTGNVIQQNITIDVNGYNCDIKLNQYDLQANDAQFKNEKLLELLQNLAQD